MLTSSNRSTTRCHTRCLPSALYSENQDSSMKRTPLQSARRHRMWAFAYSSRLRRWTAVRSRPWWGWRACRWASLRRFLTVKQKFFGYANRLLQQLSGWLISDDLGGEDAGCGGSGLVWFRGVNQHWSYGSVLVRSSCHRFGSIRYHDASQWIDDALHPHFFLFLLHIYTILSINTSSQINALNL